jgi:uncharacterized membrane protein
VTSGFPLATIRWKRLFEYLGGALIIAGVGGIAGYGAAISYAAIFELEDVDPFKIAQHAFYITGSLAVMGALLLLVAQT